MFRPIDARNGHRRYHNEAKIARCPIAIQADQTRQVFPLLAWLTTEAKVEQPSHQSPPASLVCTQGVPSGSTQPPWGWCMSHLYHNTRTSGTQIKVCSGTTTHFCQQNLPCLNRHTWKQYIRLLRLTPTLYQMQGNE